MIFGITTVLATYASVRLYEHYWKSSNNSVQDGTEIKMEQEKELEETPENLLIETDENKKNKYYVTMSGVSIGLSTARLFYPPLVLPSILLFTYTAIPYLRYTEKSLLKDKKVDGYVLYSIADTMLLGIGAYASASIGIGLLHLSKYILSNAKEQSKRQLVDIFSLA